MEFTIFYTLSRMNYNFFPNTESKIKTRVLNTINTTKKFFMSHTAKEFKQFIDNVFYFVNIFLGYKKMA